MTGNSHSDTCSNILIQTDELAAMLPDAKSKQLLPVFVGSEAAFYSAHIPGSACISPSELILGAPPAMGKIASAEQLSDVFSGIGLNDDTLVVAYDDEGGGWAGRLIWTLDILGHRNYRYLDGGMIAWQAEGRDCSRNQEPHPTSDYQAHIDNTQLVSAEKIKGSLGQDDFAIWDARSAEEHSGQKVLAEKGGRIPGARNLDWLELMDRSNHLRLKPLAEIDARLDALGLTKDKSIVTHCQSHHRSGLTYLVGKLLSRNIAAYDGSWSEWGNLPDTPVEND